MEELESIFIGIQQNADNMMLKWDEKFQSSLELLKKNYLHGGDVNDKTPKQVKKKSKVLSPIIDEHNETANRNETINGRPIRSAKGKANENLKEPSLNTKMRRENSIKKERVSVNTTTTFNKENLTNNTFKLKNSGQNEKMYNKKSTESEKRKSPNNSIDKDSDKDVNRNSKKLSKDNDSLILVANAEVKIEILSEDECEKMPPPTKMPPKGKRGPKKKIEPLNLNLENGTDSSQDSQEIRRTRSQFKQEPEEVLVRKSKRTKKKKSSTKKVEATISESSVEVNSSEIDSPILIENSQSSSERNISSITITQQNSANSQDKVTQFTSNITKESIKNDIENYNKKVSITPSIGANTTQESIYEDAIGGDMDKRVKTCTVVIEKLQLSNNTKQDVIGNSTFCLSNSNDMTFNVQPTTITPIINANDTFNIIDTNNDKNEIENSSLITEDASIPINDCSNEIIEASVERKFDFNMHYKPVLSEIRTNRNEIFNPLIQSPVKKKVEAYEKHNILASPVPQRITRTKTKENKTNKDSLLEMEYTTPAHHNSKIPEKITKHWTPSVIPQLSITKGIVSASKLAHIQKAHKSKSRENSTEDLKRGILLLTEEKKRKREEKQKLVQQLREAREKERIELAEKIAKEREEKYKKLMQEKEEKLRSENAKKKQMKDIKARENEQKKQLEEIQRNIKLQELKREEMIRIENQKRLEYQQAEAARRDREAHEHRVNSAKDDLHKKLQLQKIQEIKKKKINQQQKHHDFEALNSGDSTDEEDKTNNKKPPPPNWSRSSNRRLIILQQSEINSKVIDNFFSVQPMSPDLREIFPEIDSRYLKRNSSAVWNTPPRYSEMPKY